MKRIIIATLVCLLMSMSAWAQEGQLMLIYDETIKPSKVGEYVESSKQFFGHLMEHVPEAQWSAVMTDDMHMIYAIPLSSHGDIDEMNQTWMKMAESMGAEALIRMMEKAGENVESMSSMIVMRRDDLSYHPETMIPAEEVGALEYIYYYLRPGTEFAAEQVAREWARAQKEKGWKHGWSYYQLTLGSDMPAIAIVIPGRSPEHLVQMNAEADELMGEKGRQLQAKAMKLIRSMDRKIGWVRPDLSSAAFAPRE